MDGPGTVPVDSKGGLWRDEDSECTPVRSDGRVPDSRSLNFWKLSGQSHRIQTHLHHPSS